MSEAPSSERILDSIDVGVVVQDPSLRIRYANAAAGRLLGYSEEELLDLDSHAGSWDAIDPQGVPLPGSEHPAGLAVSTGEPVRGRRIGIRVPGRDDRIWLVVNAIPRLDGSGAVTSVLTTFAEIAGEGVDSKELADVNRSLTEAVEERTRELTAMNLRLSEASSRYEAVIRAMAEGVVIHGPEGEILEANPAALRILGVTLDQLRGLHPLDSHWRLSREDGSPLPDDEIPSEITRRTGRPCADRVLGVQRRRSELAWLSVNTDPILLDGEMIGVVATFTDVTIEREALTRLAETNRKLEWVHQMAPGAIVESRYGPDGESEITYASRAVEAVFGLTPEQMMRDSSAPRARIHPEDVEAMEEQLRAAIAAHDSEEGGQPVEMEYRFSDGAGGWRWLRSTTAPPTRVGEQIVFHSIVVDVTEEREIDRNLRESQRREFLGTLAAGIAHNFNNMLAAILPTLESARNTTEGPLADELDSAYQAANAASELVRRLARLSRNEATVDPVRVPMREIVEEIVQICARTFPSAIEVALVADDDPCPVLARRADLQQVVLNLALNARDAIEGVDAPRIEIRLSRAGASRVVVEVEDNGAGMDQETQDRLGEPFFTTKDAGRGTGLGVATLIGTVRELGGTVEWQSEVGVGSCFRVELPATSGTGPTTAPGEGRKTNGVLAGLDVLFVDDEPLVRSSLGRMIARLGGNAMEAASGAEALQRVAEATPDLVLIDLSMPGMSGAEASEKLRALHPDLPIVLMSGYLPGDAPEAVSAVLSKPFTSKTLAETLAKVLP